MAVLMESESTRSTETVDPAEVELVLSALEAGDGHAEDHHRQHPRQPYRVQAELRLFSDHTGTPPWRIYTRDASSRGLGFITRDRLPLGYGGLVEFAAPDGRTVRIQATLYRCREVGNGWFEGALYFNREQWIFGNH